MLPKQNLEEAYPNCVRPHGQPAFFPQVSVDSPGALLSKTAGSKPCMGSCRAIKTPMLDKVSRHCAVQVGGWTNRYICACIHHTQKRSVRRQAFALCQSEMPIKPFYKTICVSNSVKSLLAFTKLLTTERLTEGFHRQFLFTQGCCLPPHIAVLGMMEICTNITVPAAADLNNAEPADFIEHRPCCWLCSC